MLDIDKHLNITKVDSFFNIYLDQLIYLIPFFNTYHVSQHLIVMNALCARNDQKTIKFLSLAYTLTDIYIHIGKKRASIYVN